MTRKLKIAEFKTHLSAHLREVQKRGTELVILDRENPIAKVLPFDQPRNIITVRPARISGGLKTLKLPKRLSRLDIDVVKLLREDRDRR